MSGLRVAAIDCGTNSIRLLIAERRGGRIKELDRRLELVRLGQGVDENREFHPDALARTFTACEQYAKVIQEFGCDRVRFVATSAARDVKNRDAFFEGVDQRLGVSPDIISGDEEARLSFSGALAGVTAPVGPVVVVDIGGGSTEIVLGSSQGQVSASTSLDIGSVRLRERCLTDDPPSQDQVRQATQWVDDLLDSFTGDLGVAQTFIGVAGTVTSLAAIDHGLMLYDRKVVHGTVLGQQQISNITRGLLATPIEQVEKTTCLPPARASVIAGGALIADRLSRRLVPPMTVCETDILDGVAADLIAAG